MITLITTASSTAIIAFSSSFHAIQHWKQIISKRKDGYEEIAADLYEDEDGIATVESEAKYSTYTQKGFMLLGTLIGLGFSLSTAIRSTGDRTSSGYISDWLVFVSWVYHSIQKKITLEYDLIESSDSVVLPFVWCASHIYERNYNFSSPPANWQEYPFSCYSRS